MFLKEGLPGGCIVVIDDLPACLILKKSLDSRIQ